MQDPNESKLVTGFLVEDKHAKAKLKTLEGWWPNGIPRGDYVKLLTVLAVSSRANMYPAQSERSSVEALELVPAPGYDSAPAPAAAPVSNTRGRWIVAKRRVVKEPLASLGEVVEYTYKTPEEVVEGVRMGLLRIAFMYNNEPLFGKGDVDRWASGIDHGVTYTVPQLAKYLGLSLPSAYALVRKLTPLAKTSETGGKLFPEHEVEALRAARLWKRG